MVLEMISAGLGAIFLIVGVLGLLSKKVRAVLRGIPIGNPQLWSIIFLVLGLVTGGSAYLMNLSTASIGGGENPFGVNDQMATIGALDLKIHDGLANATTTEDYYNDDDTFLTFYSADASIADGEEYAWNITIDRQLASEDGVVTVSCNIPDKEISGVTADSLAEKTAGQVDLDINDGGRHSDDNTVYKSFALAEGTISQEVQIAFDQEETYHDGMTDLDDYVDVVCSITGDDGASASVTTRIYADS